MTFVDHLKGNNPEKLLLEVAFGLHVVQGDLAKSIVTGASPTHIVTVQHLLGEAFGRGWQGPVGAGPEGIWFRGTNRPAAKYAFYPGVQATLTIFTADSGTDLLTPSGASPPNDGDAIIVMGNLPAPLQPLTAYFVRDRTPTTFKVAATSGGAAIDLTSNGTGSLYYYLVDKIFNQDTPHSNTAWIRVEAPSGSEVGIPDFDTKSNPPLGFSGIFGCQVGDTYDANGDVDDGGTFLTNPADVLGFGCRIIREFPQSRVDWAALNTLRTACATTVTPDYTTLPQGVGLTGTYYANTSFGGGIVQKRVDPVIQFDASTGAPALGQTATGFSVRFEGKIRFKYNGTYTMTLVHNDGGKLWIENMTTPIIDQAATGTHTGEFTAVADDWFDIKLEWTNTSGNSEFTLKWNSPSQSLQVVPQDRLYPKAEAVPRFDCHMKVTQPTTFEDFLQSVLLTCNGAYQDVHGKLRFFNIDDQATVFDFNETNIIKDTLDVRPRYNKLEVRKLANRYIADGRDLDNRYLEPFDPPLTYDVTELQDLTGKTIEQSVNLGNVRRWQGIDNLRHYAKLHGQGTICTFEGMPSTLAVLHGDKVRVTHSRAGWTNKQFLVIEATDKSHDRSPANRLFKLLEW